ncbi:flagellar biosynthetic protein FliO [Rhodoferax sp. PAMC 29310]|uniref:FliO/MopB family protein n=1 Tax=Rhodoferax sp. PAMC 29310 TaxID=2822760 RepID=UPI001B332EB9|nr:flagellar biosynthetic protein FliO [Rhodoferax sp. PAMC 29310]
MNQTLLSVGLFVLLLAAVPFAIKWIQRRAPGGMASAKNLSLVSAVAVGPHQRVVTVETGPEGARVLLTLGVTAQSITALHVAPLGSSEKHPSVSLSNSDTRP